MGISCSSALKKKDKERSASAEIGDPGDGAGHRKGSAKSAESLPYGISEEIESKKSSSENSSVKPSKGGKLSELSNTIITLNENAKDINGDKLESTTALQTSANKSELQPSSDLSKTSSLSTSCKADSNLPSLSEINSCTSSPVPVYTPHINMRTPIEGTNASEEFSSKCYFNALFTIASDPYHIIAISTTRGELSVWNIYEEKSIRILVGLNQPRDVKMIDRYKALVLCNRELKLYDLNEGMLITKFKGVMNQKMPFFGLHNENLVVALSRNRMYVNIMSISTGDLETTFKVGEDRFLNSLLVSGNGKICVCGDETQKPFPLLVWDLENRKLIYDLRIPNHEFITKLSAISIDGHYVVSVCKELNSTSPNFIIVYDLESGTIFKKWKPECNSCSIAISSQGGCVVNGTEDCNIIIWDLSTGGKRYSLSGHTAPVDTLQIAESGITFLSCDSTGKDSSLRIWSIETGSCLNVFTPDTPVSCCQFTLDGNATVINYNDSSQLQTILMSHETATCMKPLIEPYGLTEKEGQEFDVSKE